MAKKKDTAEKIQVTLVKSTIGVLPKHKKIVAALGLKKVNSSTLSSNVAKSNLQAYFSEKAFAEFFSASLTDTTISSSRGFFAAQMCANTPS